MLYSVRLERDKLDVGRWHAWRGSSLDPVCGCAQTLHQHQSCSALVMTWKQYFDGIVMLFMRRSPVNGQISF